MKAIRILINNETNEITAVYRMDDNLVRQIEILFEPDAILGATAAKDAGESLLPAQRIRIQVEEILSSVPNTEHPGPLIQAVRYYREQTGAYLADAKKAVDLIKENMTRKSINAFLDAQNE